MSTTNILQQIQNKLIKKYSGDIQVISNEIDEMFGPGFVSQLNPSGDEDGVDVTDASAVDMPYTTNRSIPVPKGKKAGSNYVPFGEAKEPTNDEDDAPEALPEAPPEAPPESMPEAQPEGDMDMGDTNMGDSNIMGMMGQEEEKTPSQLGRIYELKKIYARLISIEAYLGDESDKELLEIRSYISQGVELFEVISANFNSYEDKLDEIIVIYYKFLLEIYSSVKNFYAKQKNSGD